MEDKQLDFNQPLLSVRHFASPAPGAAESETEGKKKIDNSLPKIPRPPIYKSNLKSGPIRNPGTVPFVWEKTPGRPKQERNLQNGALEQSLIAPKLPPGRALNDKKQQSSTKGWDSKNFAQPQTEMILYSSKNVSSLTQIEAKCGSSNGEMDETVSSGSEDSDDAYVDALDSLSRTESFFLNCSISGVSGLDGPDIKPAGVFSADPQTRDFMMDRFLPAAKAVASETPPYATRKQPIAQEPLRQVKKVIPVDKQQPLHVYRPNIFLNNAQDDRWDESEDEDDYSQSQNSSAKACGLFPQFLLKSSFCLMNPIPGMKIQAQKPVRPAYSVRRRHAQSSYLMFCDETENKHADAAAGKGLMGVAPTPNGFSQMSYRSDCQKPGKASLFRHLQGNDVSSYPCQSSQLVHQEKVFRNLQELMASDSINQESGSASPVVEKTLYVDSVHKVKSPNPSISEIRALTQCMEDDLEILVKPGEMEETPLVDSSSKDITHLNSVIDEISVVQHKRMESVDSYSLFSLKKYASDMQMDATNGSRRDQDLIHHPSKSVCLNVIDTESQVHFNFSHQEASPGLVVPDSITCTNSKVADLQKESSRNRAISHDSYLKLPLPLPLPKAPSESWLKRTLPNFSPKNSPSRSCLGTSNYPSGVTKWETIVRSSNVHHGHLRFSEEQLPPIPEA